MKLSEAIRVGAKLHSQGFGAFHVTIKRRWWHVFFGKPIEEKNTCALGAAIEAQGCEFKLGKGSGIPFRGEPAPEGAITYYLDSPSEWPLTYYHDCPQCEFRSLDGDRATIAVLIPHLNDEHKWTREQIALLVERLENSIHPENQIEQDLRYAGSEFREHYVAQQREVEARRAELEQCREEELRQQQEWPEEIG